MRRHWNRTSYYVVGEGVVREPLDLFSGPGEFPDATGPDPQPPLFKFGRMFNFREEAIQCLTNLGKSMGKAISGDSHNPSGYTYLGQFIAHEITFDRTKDLPETELVPDNYRSPQIDLDSLYGASDDQNGASDNQSKELYEDEVPSRLKIGWTFRKSPHPPYDNDLPRNPQTGVALIGDERNDENLAVAQFHVAFIKFHNTVVDILAPTTPADQLLEAARGQVVRHFQWIILHDYLRRLVDQDVLSDVLTHCPKFFKVDGPKQLFMPLEFSAAAFRLGHSMVRSSYEWNFHHSSETEGAVLVSQLFDQTQFSGTIGKHPSTQGDTQLPSDWVIDWRRFFDFKALNKYPPPLTGINMARRIDTSINMGLETITGFPHHPLTGVTQSISVRNLLRAYALGLPTGEEVAEWIGETPLSQSDVSLGYEEFLDSRALKGKTPLWYYVLREGDIQGGGDRLGRLGSRILAETFVGLIKNSRYSILDGSNWQPWPQFSRAGPTPGAVIFEMVDLLDSVNVVNPIG